MQRGAAAASAAGAPASPAPKPPLPLRAPPVVYRFSVFGARLVAISRATLLLSLAIAALTLCVCPRLVVRLAQPAAGCFQPSPPAACAGCAWRLRGRRKRLDSWSVGVPSSLHRPASLRPQGYTPAFVDTAAVARSCSPVAVSGGGGGEAAARWTPRRVLVTGSAGFVGAHAALALRTAGSGVVGLDNFNAYYSVGLKRARAAALSAAGVHTVEADLNDGAALSAVITACGATHVLHLAAQAGVRYAAKNPAAYVHSNLAGFVSLLEVLRAASPVPALVFASSSSVYGLNTVVPFSETHAADRPASLYAATKKSNELIAHAYAHVHGLSVTGLRFFTVYGPWGRPDMAAFAFAAAIFANRPVRIFTTPTGGELSRDFTYVDDVVAGALAAVDTAQPSGKPAPAPRLFNLGNTVTVNVSSFVSSLEAAMGAKATRSYSVLPSAGDVVLTHADISAAASALGYAPQVPLDEGLRRFAAWFKDRYGGGAHSEELAGGPGARRRRHQRRTLAAEHARERAVAAAAGEGIEGAGEEDVWGHGDAEG